MAQIDGTHAPELRSWVPPPTGTRTFRSRTRRSASSRRRARGAPATAVRMRELGAEPLSGGYGEFQALLEGEHSIWVPLIRDLRITLEG